MQRQLIVGDEVDRNGLSTGRESGDVSFAANTVGNRLVQCDHIRRLSRTS